MAVEQSMLKMLFIKNNHLKRYALFVLNGLLYCVDTLCILLPQKPRQKNGVAIVRLDGVGDFFLWLRHAVHYKDIYKNQRITLIADSSWSEFAATLPYWDAVISVNTKKLYSDVLYRWRKIQEIKRHHFEIAIEPTYSRVFLHGDSMLRATCARQKIGFVGDNANSDVFFKHIADKWYTKLFHSSSGPMMEISRNAEFLHNVSSGMDLKLPSQLLPVNLIEKDELRIQEDYFVVFPGVSWSGKKWPSRSFAEVAKAIVNQKRWRLVVCGSASEFDLCSEVIEFAQLKNSINLAGKTSLAELAEVIRSAQILIANDTAAVHIAALVSTPSVCVLGGGHFGRFLPYSDLAVGIAPIPIYNKMPCYNCNWRCTQKYHSDDPVPCIENISCENVLLSVDDALNNLSEQ